MMLGWLALAVVCAAPSAVVEKHDAPVFEAEDPAPVDPETAPSGDAAFGAQWLWASGKAMPGVALRAGHRSLEVELETSLIVLTRPAREFDTSLLGSQFGFYFMFRPLHTKRWEVAAGLGSDVYSLFNIHGDQWEVAGSLRTAGRFWFSERVGVYVTARAYPLATSGVELGVARDGSGGLPVLFGTGVEWRLQ